MRAVLGQAMLDAIDPNAPSKDREDARNFLFTERSDEFVLSQGVADTDSFRRKLRERFAQEQVEISLENSKPVTFAGWPRQAVAA